MHKENKKTERSTTSYLIVSSLSASMLFVFTLCFLFVPQWDTNDDIAMSMIAHGYGGAIAPGSPNIVFSNLLWGHLVRLIPEIHGVLGYSIATLSVLVTTGAVVLYCMLRLGIGYIASLSALVLMLVRPVLFPQFTINAGLLMVATILCWSCYLQYGDKRAITVGCLLAFFSYLIRAPEFFLVFIVALPLLSWRKLFLHKYAKISLSLLILMISSAMIIDRQAYQGEEWELFNELNPVRAAFTDYDAGELLKKQPEILQLYGYSTNDIDLITNWFFVDPSIANPQALSAMLAEIGPLATQTNALTNAWVGVKTLWHPTLLATILAALILTILNPSWRVAASWGLCVLAVFIIGLLGRPGILRVYGPLTCLLLVAPLLNWQISDWRRQFAVVVLFVAALVNSYHVFSESEKTHLFSKQVREAFTYLPNGLLFAWGGVLPYEAMYPVLANSSLTVSYRYYSLGTFTLAPFTVAYTEEKAGRGMINLLTREKGIRIVLSPEQLKMLDIYCKEHLRGKLKELSNQQYMKINVSQIQCAVTL